MSHCCDGRQEYHGKPLVSLHICGLRLMLVMNSEFFLTENTLSLIQRPAVVTRDHLIWTYSRLQKAFIAPILSQFKLGGMSGSHGDTYEDISLL
jgi:hypothetical protein